MERAATTTQNEGARSKPRTDGQELVLLSFLMLFLELMLIRWSAAFVIYISYFSNFVLLASFLGIGLGFLRPERGQVWLKRLPFLLAGFLGFVLIFQVQVAHFGGRSLDGLFGAPALPIWAMLPALFLLVVGVMSSVATGVASVFGRLDPLTAYRLDVMGSLLGIAAFSLVSLLSAPPIVWGLVVTGLLSATHQRPVRTPQVLGVAGMLLMLGLVSVLPGERWSPYYRVTESDASTDGVVGINVNGLPHQSMIPLSLVPTRQPFYLYPYQHLRNQIPANVLVIGAGSGNDVAVALAQGAKHIDAVEIDPVILSIGQRDHPDLPYSSPRVAAYVDDGRAFLQQNDTKYDLIIFALPDSLTLVSGQASLRLESYLFTVEAMEEVRGHLAAGGAFTMYNYYRPDVFERFAETIRLAFGHAPCVDLGPGRLGGRAQAVLTVGLLPQDIDCTTPWMSSDHPASTATDNWPFPYLARRSIPSLYLVTILLILASSLFLVRRYGGHVREMGAYSDLFFMGAAFLLLETKNVVQFALLFGTTWFVNALVFGGILLAVLAAIEVARRWRLPSPWTLYAALLVALAGAWAVQPSSLLSLPSGVRFIAATGIAFTPVFLANLIFAQRFRDVSASRVAFAANLLGAMVGGLLEYTAMLTGYRALLVLVGFLYLAAFLTWRQRTTLGDTAIGSAATPTLVKTETR